MQPMHPVAWYCEHALPFGSNLLGALPTSDLDEILGFRRRADACVTYVFKWTDANEFLFGILPLPDPTLSERIPRQTMREMCQLAMAAEGDEVRIRLGDRPMYSVGGRRLNPEHLLFKSCGRLALTLSTTVPVGIAHAERSVKDLPDLSEFQPRTSESSRNHLEFLARFGRWNEMRGRRVRILLEDVVPEDMRPNDLPIRLHGFQSKDPFWPMQAEAIRRAAQQIVSRVEETQIRLLEERWACRRQTPVH